MTDKHAENRFAVESFRGPLMIVVGMLVSSLAMLCLAVFVSG